MFYLGASEARLRSKIIVHILSSLEHLNFDEPTLSLSAMNFDEPTLNFSAMAELNEDHSVAMISRDSENFKYPIYLFKG